MLWSRKKTSLKARTGTEVRKTKKEGVKYTLAFETAWWRRRSTGCFKVYFALRFPPAREEIIGSGSSREEQRKTLEGRIWGGVHKPGDSSAGIELELRSEGSRTQQKFLPRYQKYGPTTIFRQNVPDSGSETAKSLYRKDCRQRALGKTEWVLLRWSRVGPTKSLQSEALLVELIREFGLVAPSIGGSELGAAGGRIYIKSKENDACLHDCKGHSVIRVLTLIDFTLLDLWILLSEVACVNCPIFRHDVKLMRASSGGLQYTDRAERSASVKLWLEAP
ncbi:hypothetical protein B0H16DRAFT_1701155 [Mycena metata]|uniref:Uncharacterized protein n=1 Tax=Mycena metata TaxID=1033252 RepID=A0AAD7MI18_9AGAR|nr:hypothetical protein B0H16DRAFT_1701155 [Mycena metata]